MHRGRRPSSGIWATPHAELPKKLNSCFGNCFLRSRRSVTPNQQLSPPTEKRKLKGASSTIMAERRTLTTAISKSRPGQTGPHDIKREIHLLNFPRHKINGQPSSSHSSPSKPENRVSTRGVIKFAARSIRISLTFHTRFHYILSPLNLLPMFPNDCYPCARPKHGPSDLPCPARAVAWPRVLTSVRVSISAHLFEI